jgi:HSP20 family protein
MLRSVFPQDILAELSRLHREAAEAGAPDDAIGAMASTLPIAGRLVAGPSSGALTATSTNAGLASAGAASLESHVPHVPAGAVPTGAGLIGAPGIRESRGTRFPALNLRTSPMSIEIEAFLPGMSVDALQLSIEGDVLVLSGERESQLPDADDGATVHAAERFSGRFRRVIGLPPDTDTQAIEARYALGVLTITVPRLQPVQARPILIQDPAGGLQ